MRSQVCGNDTPALTLRTHYLLVFVGLALLVAGASPQPARAQAPPQVESDAEHWRPYSQPGDGVLWLPATFTVVDLVGSATGSAWPDGSKVYQQQLFNAKGIHGDGVASLIAMRFWVETKEGALRPDSPKSAKSVAEAALRGMQSQGLVFGVIESPRAFSLGQLEGWRGSWTINGGASRQDQFVIERNGIVYAASIVYSTSSAFYWTHKTDEIVRYWVPSGVVGAHAPIEARPATGEWQVLKYPTGQRLTLPPTWVVIDRDRPATSLASGKDSHSVRVLFNARPSRDDAEAATVRCLEIRTPGNEVGAIKDWSESDLIEILDAFATAHGQASPSMRRVSARRSYVGEVLVAFGDYRTPEGASPQLGATVAVIVNGPVVYLLTASHVPNDSQRFGGWLREVIARSEFSVR